MWHEAVMPIYSYCCPDKHQFDRIVSVDKRDDLQPCPEWTVVWGFNGEVRQVCQQLSERVGIELNAKSFPGADSWRKK